MPKKKKDSWTDKLKNARLWRLLNPNRWHKTQMRHYYKNRKEINEQYSKP